MININSLSKEYVMGDNKLLALDKIDLSINEGDFVSIMGSSGSGKSTLMNIIGCLDVPSSGEYHFRNNNVLTLNSNKLAELRNKDIGFVFQNFNLLPRLNATENVVLPLLYSGKNLKERNKLALEALESVGLKDRIHHRPNQLSGGQQQRVSIARAIAGSPKLILADEPTGALDSKTGLEIMKILNDLNAKGITIVLVTHEDDIANYGSRIIKMKDGRILEDKKMSITDLIYLSQKSLRSNILRSILTSLGIIIGVSSVITMISIGSGARIEVEQQIERFGSNNLIVRSQSSSNRGVSMGANSVNTLTLKDMEALIEELPAIKAIAPRVSLSTQIVANGNNWLATVTGTTNDYFDLGNWKFENGRSFEEEELNSGSRVAIIGKTVQKNLFDTDSPIDEVIRINKVPFTVIGLLDAKGGTAWADLDDTIIVPLKTAKQRLVAKKFPGDQIRSMTINVRSSDLLFKTEKDVDTVMRKLHKISANGNPDFVIRNYAQFLNARQESSRVMSILLATVAGISLIVGGIGIMNIMLVTVTERTKEIGVCMSVGAKKRDILLQFLIESLMISLIGGLIGIALGLGVIFGVSEYFKWKMSLDYMSIVLSFIFSSSIGIIFGFYPARKAANLNPIDALRYE